MRYEPLRPGSPREDLASAIERGDTTAIDEAILRLSLDPEEDWRWVQDKCLMLLRYEDPSVRAISATSLGHIARVHGRIDRTVVLPALEELLADPRAAGKVSDALDDIEQFVGK